jgi:hypothetical protein
MARTANSASGEKAPVYEVLAHDIKAMGVEAVFGLMSDDTALFATSLDTAGFMAPDMRTRPSPWPMAMPMPPAASVLP